MSNGAGFIGSHLIDHLMKAESNHVTCIDDFSNGSIHNIHKWLNNPRFQLIKHNILSPLSFEVNKIWHLSCYDSSSRLLIDPIHTSRSTILSMLFFARSCFGK